MLGIEIPVKRLAGSNADFTCGGIDGKQAAIVAGGNAVGDGVAVNVRIGRSIVIVKVIDDSFG